MSGTSHTPAARQRAEVRAVIRGARPDAVDYDAALPLYGDGEGPRVLVEYAVRPRPGDP